MRHGKKLRADGSVKKTASVTAKRRQARKKSHPRATPAAAKPLKLPHVVAPPTQASRQALLFWPAFPIAMMRMWLRPREDSVGK
jgi:hypothetical protein